MSLPGHGHETASLASPKVTEATLKSQTKPSLNLLFAKLETDLTCRFWKAWVEEPPLSPNYFRNVSESGNRP